MTSYVKAAVKHVKAGLDSISGSLLPNSGQEFQNACEEADKCLDDLSKMVELPLDEIAATREQLQNKEILISAFGRHNAGKSTLLNALLHDELLPMNLRNETGIRINVWHDSRMHKGPCTSHCKDQSLQERTEEDEEIDICPQLLAEGQPHDLTHRSGKVCEKLKEANMDAKIPGGQSRRTHYTIVSNVPALANAPQGWKVMMTDNPGFGEAHQEYIAQLAETSLKTSTAYLYVVDVSQLQDKVDAHSFKLLHAKDEGVFNNNRVIIVVTQFDKTFSPVEHNQMSEEEAKRIVRDMIKSSTGFEASPIVIPVCSLWAFVARKFRHFPNDSKFRQYILSELGKCPRGQQEIPEKLEPALLADRLEEQSGIHILEERIREMTGACAEIWAMAMTKNYRSYLRLAADGIIMLLDSTRKTLQVSDTNLKQLIEQYALIECSQNKLIRNKEAGSEVYQELLQNSRKDVEGLKATLEQHTNDFAKRCEKKLRKGEETFGPDEFKKDLTEFWKEVTIELEKAADAMYGFKETCAAHRVHVEKVGEVITEIISIAQKLLAAVEVHNGAPDKGVETDFSEFFEDREISHTDLTVKVPIPELTLTFGEKVVKFMRWTVSWWFGPPKYNYKSHECLNDSMEQLRTHVKETERKYLADIEVHVAEHFLKGYRKVVDKELQAFEGDFQKIKKLKEEEEASVKRLKEKISNLDIWRQRIMQLMEKLEQKREVYCISLQRQFNHGGTK